MKMQELVLDMVDCVACAMGIVWYYGDRVDRLTYLMMLVP
jgi:hypothetical protein